MVQRTRSNNISQHAQEAKLDELAATETCGVIKAEEEIELDIGLTTVEDKELTMRNGSASTTVTFRVAEEDLIDYDDDDLELAQPTDCITRVNLDNEDFKAKEKTESFELKTASTPAEQATYIQTMLEAAKDAMRWSTETILIQTPGMASALQLKEVGDAVTVEVFANGFTYDITWKVKGPCAPDPETQAAIPPVAIPTSAPSTATVRCKFGRACIKGTQCSYSHTKLCTWVNTETGCAKGTACEHSHEIEGVKCTRSLTRDGCANGRGCAFKHIDDAGSSNNTVAPPIEGKIATYKSGKEYGLGKGTGQKRARERDNEPGNVAQRQRVHDHKGDDRRGGKHHRGRSRGQGRGRGGHVRGNSRGRGGAGASRPELHIRGFATRGAQ